MVVGNAIHFAYFSDFVIVNINILLTTCHISIWYRVRKCAFHPNKHMLNFDAIFVLLVRPRLAYCSKCLSCWQWYWCSCTQQVAIVMQCTSNKELVYSELICEKWYRRKCLWLFIETYILLCKRSFVFCWTGLQLMLSWKAFSIF